MRKIVLAIVLLSVASSAHAQVGRNRANYATCSGSVPVCINLSQGKADAAVKCRAAGAECMKTGIFVGPYSGRTTQAEKK